MFDRLTFQHGVHPPELKQLTADKRTRRLLYEFRLDNEVIAVSVVDHLPQALSAVYTFFDPELSHLSLGSFAILWLIEETKRLGHRWLYLGYWIRDSRKMAYKDNYRPIEALVNGHWLRFQADEKISAEND